MDSSGSHLYVLTSQQVRAVQGAQAHEARGPAPTTSALCLLSRWPGYPWQPAHSSWTAAAAFRPRTLCVAGASCRAGEAGHCACSASRWAWRSVHLPQPGWCPFANTASGWAGPLSASLGCPLAHSSSPPQPQESIPDGAPHSGPCARLHCSSSPRLTVKTKGCVSVPRPCGVSPFLSERSPFPCPPLAALCLDRIMPLTAHHPGSPSPTQDPIGPLPHRCTRKSQCRRATQPNQWLWTYEDGLCLHIQSVLPAHHPRQEQGQVSPIFLLSFCLCPHPPCLDPSASAPWPPPKVPTCWVSSNVPQVTLLVPRLPTLAMDEYFHCAFGNYDSLAHVEGPQVACVTPPQDQLPLNPPGTGEGPLG